MLEILAPGGATYTDDLCASFCSTILDLPEPPSEGEQPVFNLDLLLDRRFDFPTDYDDHVTGVYLRELTLRMPGKVRRSITLRANASLWAPEAVHDLLNEAIDRERVDYSRVTVTAARFQMFFLHMPRGVRRDKPLSFSLGLPDSCSLKDEPYDQIAKRYLRRWGIAPDGLPARSPSAA